MATTSLTPGTSPDGRTRLHIIRPEVTREAVADSELQAANWVLSRESEISAGLLHGLVSEYERVRPLRKKRHPGDDFDATMPAIQGPHDLRRLIGLSAVYIPPPLRHSVAYAGFLFGCTWDPEHGIGALMRGTSPVAFGGADVAFAFHPPEDDPDT